MAGAGRIAQADIAIVMSPEQAGAIAQTWLFETWTARERASFTLPPSRLYLEPGDTVSIRIEGRPRAFRIIGISDHGEREVEALATDEAVYQPSPVPGRTVRLGSPPIAGLPLVEMLDLPLLRGDEAGTTGYVAATQTPWPGGIAFYSSPEMAGFALAAVTPAPATMGALLDDLGPGPVGRHDKAAKVRVRLDRGELLSASRIATLAGANLAALRNLQGEWEVVQFETAALVAPSTYLLSGLLRGQAGTEGAMAGGLPAGTRLVLLDAAVTAVELSAAQIGLPLNWRYGPWDRDLGEESFAGRVQTFRGVGNRPLSPVHVRGRRSGGNTGDLTLSWIRRTRTGGDSWDAAEVPLGEEAERYDIEILDESTVVRTISASTPGATYTEVQQVADFGAAQSAVAVRVYQVNNVWGRGSPALATV